MVRRSPHSSDSRLTARVGSAPDALSRAPDASLPMQFAGTATAGWCHQPAALLTLTTAVVAAATYLLPTLLLLLPHAGADADAGANLPPPLPPRLLPNRWIWARCRLMMTPGCRTEGLMLAVTARCVSRSAAVRVRSPCSMAPSLTLVPLLTPAPAPLLLPMTIEYIYSTSSVYCNVTVYSRHRRHPPRDHLTTFCFCRQCSAAPGLRSPPGVAGATAAAATGARRGRAPAASKCRPPGARTRRAARRPWCRPR